MFFAKFTPYEASLIDSSAHSYWLPEIFSPQQELSSGSFEKNHRKELLRELSDVQKSTQAIFRKIEGLERQIISPLERSARERAFASGNSMGAEDLL